MRVTVLQKVDNRLMSVMESCPNTVLTESIGKVEIEVPNVHEGTFEPPIVKKLQRWLTGVGEMVLSLYAKMITTGTIHI